jgi:hypothetical protein
MLRVQANTTNGTYRDRYGLEGALRGRKVFEMGGELFAQSKRVRDLPGWSAFYKEWPDLVKEALICEEKVIWVGYRGGVQC